MTQRNQVFGDPPPNSRWWLLRSTGTSSKGDDPPAPADGALDQLREEVMLLITIEDGQYEPIDSCETAIQCLPLIAGPEAAGLITQ